MEGDPKAESFSEALFTYLWFTENLISAHTAAEMVGEMSEFIAEVAKAVVVLSALTVPSFNECMEEYFERHDMSRRSVFTFLTKYCFDEHTLNDDIFAVVLNTCTFVYRLVIFCQHRGHVEYIEFAAMCWGEIFRMDLKQEFYAKGGWEELKNYILENRYIPKNRETDQQAFVNFLNEINYLFPKLVKLSEGETIELGSSPSSTVCNIFDVDDLANLSELDSSPDASNKSEDAVLKLQSNISDAIQNEEARLDLVDGMLTDYLQHNLCDVKMMDITNECTSCQVSDSLQSTCDNAEAFCARQQNDRFYQWFNKNENNL